MTNNFTFTYHKTHGDWTLARKRKKRSKVYKNTETEMENSSFAKMAHYLH